MHGGESGTDTIQLPNLARNILQVQYTVWCSWVKFLSQWPMDKQWSESVDSSVHEAGTQVQLTLILQVSYLFSANYVGVAKVKCDHA